MGNKRIQVFDATGGFKTEFGNIGTPIAMIVIAILGLPTPSRAQTPARVSLDSVAGIDLFRGQGVVDRPDASLDIVVTFRRSLSAMVIFKSRYNHRFRSLCAGALRK